MLGKHHNVHYIIKLVRTIGNPGIRFDKLTVMSISQSEIQWASDCIAKIILSIIIGVWCDNDSLTNHTGEDIGNGVRLILIATTNTDKVTLQNPWRAWQIVIAKVKNLCYWTFMIGINVLMRLINFDLYLIEYTLRSHKEVTSRRITSPDNSRSTINLQTQLTVSHEPVQCRKVTSQNRIFGVFDVSVLHQKSSS